MNSVKQFHIGMYGGKFLPWHKGHAYCIETAARECDIVYVILFYGGADEEAILKQRSESWLLVEERKARLDEVCRGAEGLAEIIPAAIDISTLKHQDGTDDWDAETPIVRRLLGDKLDAVYSSEESYGEYFRRAYPEAVHRLVDIHRIKYPISSTMIRDMQSEEKRAKWVI